MLSNGTVSHEGIANFISSIIERHLGSTSTTLFFLMGAMTIVEVVDQNGGFDWVKGVMNTRSKRKLLWRIAFLTFVLSAVLDNLTTSIVMVMILRKLVADKNDRIIYASLVIIAANSGGAFSPIGDVTTIMLWNKGLITAAGVISEILLPSLVSMIIPAFILQYHLKGELVPVKDNARARRTRATSLRLSARLCSGSVSAVCSSFPSSRASPTFRRLSASSWCSARCGR